MILDDLEELLLLTEAEYPLDIPYDIIIGLYDQVVIPVFIDGGGSVLSALLLEPQELVPKLDEVPVGD
jgi:hypothetical protein